MALYIRKAKSDILREALRKLETKSSISATSPGSIARAFTEAITTEIADYYDALDFQIAQSVISTASGRALDLLGDLYGVKRKTVNDLIATDAKIGSFYFYIDSPYTQDIIIPNKTKVFTSTDSFVGQQLTYYTTGDTVIPLGQTRAFASLTPAFTDAIFTAAPNTLVANSLISPIGTLVKCVNPKAISAQPGFEDDNNYRVRIVKSIKVSAAGTIDAVRFAALSVAGVRDAKIIENIYGLGSFQIVVTPEDISFAATAGIELVAKLNSVRPIGVKMFMTEPTLVPVYVTVTAIVKNDSTINTEVMSNRITIAIKRYLNSLLAGDTLVYNRLVQYMLDVSADVLDVQVTQYAPRGVESLRRNYTPNTDEVLIPGRIEVNIASQQ